MTDHVRPPSNISTKAEYAALAIFKALGEPKGTYPGDFEEAARIALKVAGRNPDARYRGENASPYERHLGRQGSLAALPTPESEK